MKDICDDIFSATYHFLVTYVAREKENHKSNVKLMEQAIEI